MKTGKWTPPIAWAALIEVLTSWPRMPTFGAPAGTDKVVHFFLYGVFGVLVARAAAGGRPSFRSAVAIVIVLSAWGALDEWHQRFIDGRTADIADWVTDTAAVMVGVAARARYARMREVRVA
ncbi:MAG TPA: VanZ family protein [Gemmatimonadaceae bacterium]|nr:VanZ family protein [Gemmatimonadaceae bacterium]